MNKKKQGKLKKHLASYSSIVGAAMLLTPVVSDAAIVYTDPGDTSSMQNVSIDFNGDSTVDLLIKAGAQSGIAASDVKVPTGDVMGPNSIGDCSNHYGAAYGSGVTIGSAGIWDGNPSNVLMYSAQGPWANASQKFLGVKFSIGGNVHYGWVRMSCTAAPEYRFTLHDYAYEDVPNTAILTGAVGSINTAPVVGLDTVGGGIDVSRSFTEDAGAVKIAPNATVSDSDGDEIQTVTITLTNDQDGAAEALYLGSATNVTITGSGTDTLTLTTSNGTTNAQFQTALQAVTYNNTSNTPNTTARSITVVANDGTDNSATATVTMTVAVSNDPPTDISLSSPSVDEGQPSGAGVGTLSATDPDD